MRELHDPQMILRPQGWDDARVKKFTGTVLLRAMGRNGAKVYKLAARHKDPISGRQVRRKLEENAWQAAMRIAFGIGFQGVAGRVEAAVGSCSCNRGKPQTFENVFDQHWASTGCKYSCGGNNTRHERVQGAFRRLQRAAGAGLPMSYDITNYTLSPEVRLKQNPKRNMRSAMDTVLSDDVLNQKTYVDYCVYNSTGKTMQSKSDDAQRVLQLAHISKTEYNASCYAHIAEPRNALLVTFALDALGSFHPLDPKHAPVPRPALGLGSQPFNCTQPDTILKALFNGAPPGRGRSRLSREEGLVLMLSSRATAGVKGIKAFDRTYSDKAAAGLLASHTYRDLAHQCIKYSARSACQAMEKHRDRTIHHHQPP